jgi:tRNA modification GTPase
MSESPRDTIFALSSGRGPAAIAVVRISGPRAGGALTALGCKIPEPRRAGLARIRDSATNEIIDEGLALWFPGPRSETGEDIVELQLHGGRAVIAATLRALARIDGLRPAEAGEFTRRAFENGKLDLTAVEGLADLVSAETEGQRRQAFRQMKGALGGRAEHWRGQIIQALALVEARIDFSDEADVPDDLVAPALAIARALAAEIAAALADGGRGERLREGLVVAIAGPPNAGKSTLLNRLARREAAIVSPYAGTTRDVIEVHLDLGGLPATLLDTAGIRETDDPVELEGVRRARDRASAADLVLWVIDASEGGGGIGGEGAESMAEFAAPQPPVWTVRNKSDLVDQTLTRNESRISDICRNEAEKPFNDTLKSTVNQDVGARSEAKQRTNDALKNVVNSRLTGCDAPGFKNTEQGFNISAVSDDGFDSLLAALTGHAEQFLAGAESALVTRERHRRALEDTLVALRRALSGDLAGREDLLAEELRIAAAALGRLTGRVDVEDILDVIFRDFCIGK